MTSFVTIVIGQLHEGSGSLVVPLGGDDELVHGHTGIQGYRHPRKVTQLSLLNTVGSVLPEKLHKFEDAHTIIFNLEGSRPIYNQSLNIALFFALMVILLTNRKATVMKVTTPNRNR